VEIVEVLETGYMPPDCNGGVPGDPNCIPADDFDQIEEWVNNDTPE
jgi:hypothetical protein